MQKNLQLLLKNYLRRIRNNMILWVWIWQESFYKWVIPAACDMQTMLVAKSMMVPFQKKKAVYKCRIWLLYNYAILMRNVVVGKNRL